MSADRKDISKNISGTNGSKTSQSDAKYTSKQMMYPDDLMTEQYGGNYAVFFVNVTADSKLDVNNSKFALDPAVASRDRPDIVAKPVTTSSLTGSTAVLNTLASAGAIGAAGAAIFSKARGGGASLTKSLLKGGAAATGAAALANIPTLGVAITGANAPESTRTKRRTVATIALHVPNQLSVRYSTSWSDEETAGLSMAEDGMEEIFNAFKNKSRSAVEGAVGAGAEDVQAIVLSRGAGKVTGGALSAKLGIAANPKKEQVFRGLDFRTFTFDYQFFPRSPNEAKQVLDIIETFKYHMHPEFKSEHHFVWIYPSEFDILYYNNGKENEHLHKHTSCVLESMNVNYTPNGSFTTFANGMPTQINMSLQFKELLLLSKEQIRKGM
jgi:hypothetical protein